MYGLQLDVRGDQHRLSLSPASAVTGFSARSKGYTGSTPAHRIDEIAPVLRLLIERFGGEATSTALIKHTALERRSMRGSGSSSGSWLGGILDELEGCKAITLEELGETGVIARIAPHGVVLAYE